MIFFICINIFSDFKGANLKEKKSEFLFFLVTLWHCRFVILKYLKYKKIPNKKLFFQNFVILYYSSFSSFFSKFFNIKDFLFIVLWYVIFICNFCCNFSCNFFCNIFFIIFFCFSHTLLIFCNFVSLFLLNVFSFIFYKNFLYSFFMNIFKFFCDNSPRYFIELNENFE